MFQKSKRLLMEFETTSIWWLPVFVLPWLILFLLVLLNYHSLPTSILEENELSYPNRFIGERANELNIQLSLIGERVFGSYQNEELAVEFLRRQIDDIITTRNPIHDITYDIQKSSGSFQIDKTTALYADIQNVVVKFSPATEASGRSLLINSHFDSVPVSPGAGDAGVWVSVMLEMLRVLSKQDWTFSNSIIFLFNGAQEIKLQGSHMFITQHRWAAEVGAFINLDSFGTGGKEVMFQSTAHNKWMVNQYKRVATHPTASVLGNEFFSSGLIPSDTDFRIFRDFGNIPGLDFALYRNGYIHHTKHDTHDLVHSSTFQNSGDNILNLVRAVADSPQLSATTIDDEHGDLVFFDFLGWFLISYTKTEGIIINTLVICVAIGTIFLSMRGIRNKSSLSSLDAAKELGIIIIIQALCLAIGLGLLLLLAVIYDAAHRSMTWFSNPWLLFGIYICPMFFCLGIGPSLYITFRKEPSIHLIYYIQMFLHSQCIFLIITTLTLTGLGVRSAFILMFDIVFYTSSTLLNVVSGLQHKDGIWIIIHLMGQVVPFMFYSYCTIFSMNLFVPIQGRSDPSANPDFLIAILLFGQATLLGGLIIPTLSLFKRSFYIMCTFMVIFLAFAIVMATSVGFPYRYAVSPQRFWIFHTERSFYNFDGSLRKEDSTYFILAMDRHTDDYSSKIPTAYKTLDECPFEMLCGAPLYSTRMFGQSESSYFIQADKPNFPVKTTLTLLDAQMLADRVKRFEFQVNGPDHLVIAISPLPGREMTNWNLLDHIPEDVQIWKSNIGDRLTYFVQAAFGNGTMDFFLDINIDSAFGIAEPAFDIVVVGHYNHYTGYDTTEFKNFTDGFPEWAHITPWISSYNSMIDDEHGDLVFFDFLGWFLISYTKTEGIIINTLVICVAIGTIFLSMRGIRNKSSLSSLDAAKELVIIIIIQALCLAIGLGLLLLLAVIYDAAHRSMTWFSNPWLLFGIYICPMFFCLGIGPSLYITFRKKPSIHLIYYIQMFLHSQCIFLIITTLTLTGLGVRSAFILMFDIVFYTSSTLLNVVSGLQHKDGIWIIIHLMGQVVPFMFYSYCTIFSMNLFVPIQGRSDPSANPDFLIAILLFGQATLLGGLIIPTLSLFKRSFYIMCTFMVIFLAFAIVTATSVGFPYRYAVSPQRFWIFHTERSFYNFDGSLRKEDSTYFILAMDRHTDDYSSKIPTAYKTLDECPFEMLCGAPLYSTRMFGQSESSYFIQADKPNFPVKTTLTLLDAQMLADRVKRFEFQVNGPDHLVIAISPLPGREMTNWNLLDHIPEDVQIWKSNIGDRLTYFVQAAFGNGTMDFFLDINIDSAFGIAEPAFDIVVVGHYNHYTGYDTTEFKNFTDGFPEWAHITPWISSYNSMVF